MTLKLSFYGFKSMKKKQCMGFSMEQRSIYLNNYRSPRGECARNVIIKSCNKLMLDLIEILKVGLS